MTKKCSKCKEEKDLVEFSKDKSKKSGYCSLCKICKKEYRDNNQEHFKEFRRKKYLKNKGLIPTYAETHKDQVKEYQKNYWIKNKDKLKKDACERYMKNIESERQKRREYQKTHKTERNKKLQDRRKGDPLFKLSIRIRSLIANSINRNGYKKSSKTSKILGCSFEEFKLYLESKFEPWMTWKNHGLYNGELDYGWDIDHIKPSSSALTEEIIIKLNHYTNFQPLCSKVNRDIKKHYF